MAEDLTFPNGSVSAPDGKVLVVGECFANRFTAFDLEGGNLSGRREWVIPANRPPPPTPVNFSS